MLKEQELISKIEEMLPEVFPSFKVGSLRTIGKTMSGSRIDILATLAVPTVKKPLKLAIEVKSNNRLSAMLEAAYEAKLFAKATDAIPVVASQFLGERSRDVLKKEGVSYLDLAGNFYLNLPNVYAERIVDKNPFSKTRPLKNIFAPVSSRITRAMLIEPKRAWNISDLSKTTEVSIGQTYNVLEAMAAENLARKNDDGKWIVEDPTALLDAWKEFYPTYENRKYTFFSYAANAGIDMVWEASNQARLPYFALGFFSGADMIAPFIRGLSKVQFYVSDRQAVEQWKDALQLKEVQSGGNVEMYIPYDRGVFYKPQAVSRGQKSTVPVVSNVQLYMDLFNNPARGEEAAEHLRKEKIGF